MKQGSNFTKDYLNYPLVCRLLSNSDKIVKKCPLQLLTDQGGVLKCLVLSDQQATTQRFSVYNFIKQRKATHPLKLSSSETRECLKMFHYSCLKSH